MYVCLSAGIYAPICLKKAVDALGGVVNQAAVHRTVQALLLSGLCRVANTLAKEAQGPIFTPIAQVLPSPSCIFLQAIKLFMLQCSCHNSTASVVGCRQTCDAVTACAGVWPSCGVPHILACSGS